MSIKTIVKYHASPLEVGQASGHEVCPRCNGGATHESSFIVRKLPHGTYYQCYRASCGLKGFLKGDNNQFHAPVQREFVPRTYHHETQELNEEQLEWFRTKWELTPAEISEQGILFTPSRNSYVYPIYNYIGYQVGVVDRAYWGRRTKSYAFWEKDDIKLHFPRGELKEDTLLIVEDQLSAIKGRRFMHSCALLGTSFSLDTASYLSERFKNVILALDADASAKAIKYQQNFSAMFGNFQTLLLSKDIKDTPHPQIQEILDERKDS